MSRASRSSDPPVRRADRRCLLLSITALPLLALASPIGPAAAQSARLLDAPRIAGIVGERYDGYAVAHGKAPPDIAALIDKVNAERRAVYEKRAAANHVPIDVEQQIYAQQIRQFAPAGTWFLSPDGQWTQK